MASAGGTVAGATASGDEQGGALSGFSGLIALIHGDDTGVLSGGGEATDVDVISGVEGTTGGGWVGEGAGGEEADPVEGPPTTPSRLLSPPCPSGAHWVNCAGVSV
ncbi:MAG: hypothetical protein CV090_15115 [Nitrospira sp. WS238]|nr:hypothetical protein [Nitrospira sp. WS238]